MIIFTTLPITCPKWILCIQKLYIKSWKWPCYRLSGLKRNKTKPLQYGEHAKGHQGLISGIINGTG